MSLARQGLHGLQQPTKEWLQARATRMMKITQNRLGRNDTQKSMFFLSARYVCADGILLGRLRYLEKLIFNISYIREYKK